jgi:hypothetical protein
VVGEPRMADKARRPGSELPTAQLTVVWARVLEASGHAVVIELLKLNSRSHGMVHR